MINEVWKVLHYAEEEEEEEEEEGNSQDIRGGTNLLLGNWRTKHLRIGIAL